MLKLAARKNPVNGNSHGLDALIIFVIGVRIFGDCIELKEKILS